jgi:diguanylate cyclase (GGDEF)-like protein
MKIFASTKKSNLFFWTIAGLIGIVVVGFVDFLTGQELGFSLFYLIPILMVTWFSGRNLGLVMSVISAIAWLIADIHSGETYAQPLIRYWNTGLRFGFFVVVTFLLPALKGLEREKEVARHDALTGAANRRYFFEVIKAELNRSQRYKHPFTVVYLDLDNFKAVNDKWGHSIGDRLLCVVVQQAKLHLRNTDFLARLGGDEFILLLPETDQEAAKIIVPRIQSALLDEMQCHDWPVTFSIGVLTCFDAHLSMDELVSKVDAVMYSVKNNGKNAIAYASHTGQVSIE